MKPPHLIIVLLFFFNLAVSAQDWYQLGNGTDIDVYDILSFDDEIYIGGRFGVAVYNSEEQNWNLIHNYWNIHAPMTLEEYQGEIYVSGDFNGSNGSPTRVYKLINGEWEQKGANFSGADWNSIKKIKKYNNHLYAGGQFEKVGNLNTKNIAKWDGENWSSIPNDIDGIIIKMDTFQNSLIVCHKTLDTIQVNDTLTTYRNRYKLQSWNDDNWTDLDSIFGYEDIILIGITNNKLYFITRNPSNIHPIKNVGEWDGNSITYIDGSLFHSVTDVCYYHNQLYIAGKIKTTNPVAPISVVRKRTDKGWEVVSDIFDDFIRTMERHDSSLIFGGTFEKHGNQIVNHIIAYDTPIPIIEIEDNNEDEINKTKIFPNPTNSLIQIYCKIHTLKSISLYSIDGKLVNSWENINQSTFEIDIKKLSSGIYILKIINDLNKASHHKIIKN